MLADEMQSKGNSFNGAGGSDMHDVLGLSWFFYTAMAIAMAAPFVAAVGVAVCIYYAWRAIKKRRAAAKRKALK